MESETPQTILNETIAYYTLMTTISEEEREAAIRDARLMCALDKRMYVQYRSAAVKSKLIGHDPACYNDIEVAPPAGIHPVVLLTHLMARLESASNVTVDDKRCFHVGTNPTFFVHLDDVDGGGRVVYGYGAFRRFLPYDPRMWATHRDASLRRLAKS